MMGVHVLPEVNFKDEPTLTWMLFAGRASALFALLAGVSLAFSSGGTRRLTGRPLAAARTGVAVRAVVIMAIGLLLGYADPGVDIILAFYGAMFLLAVPLLGLRPRTLAILAAVFALAGPVLLLALRPLLPVPDNDNPTFSTLAEDPFLSLGQLLFTGGYPAVPWMAYMCAGLASGRMDLRSRRTTVLLLGFGFVLAAGCWLVSGLLLSVVEDLSAGEIVRLLVDGYDPDISEDSWWWLIAASPYSSMPLELLHTIGTAMIALGTLLAAGRHLHQVLAVLAPAGSMTLTLYSAHLLFLATGMLGARPFESFGLQVGAALVAGVLWRNLAGAGPLERLVSAASNQARNRVAGGDSP